MTTQSTVAPPSPGHIVMLATLAQRGPLAMESVIRKRNRLTMPTFRSQNRPILASGANRASHSFLRLAENFEIRQLTDVLQCKLQQHFSCHRSLCAKGTR
jgi:hypothetical protein